MSQYYVTNGENEIVGKFDGVDVNLKDNHKKHDVETVEDLSGVDVDDWAEDYATS